MTEKQEEDGVAGLENLEAALREFDRTAANLAKLERVCEQIASELPQGIVFGTDSPHAEDLRRAFHDLAVALPAIDGFTIEARPWTHDEVAQARLDAEEVGEVYAISAVEREIDEPARELAEYRYRLNAARRAIVRAQVEDVLGAVDRLLHEVEAADGLGRWLGAPRWSELSELIARLDRLVGETVPGHARWNDLRRHLRFAQSNDLSDIKTMDWPSVRAEVEAALYDDYEPLPIQVDDLGALVSARPTGPVSTRLRWSVLSDEQFEAVVFELLRTTSGYENSNWLMRTHAADRGRDLETYRVISDPLAGVSRHRVIVQCKHGANPTVGRADMVQCVEAVTLWEPPTVDVLIIATSGRFSQDAVAKAEQRRQQRQLPAVELWPDSHLETLLARRPDIAAKFGLR